MDTIRGPLYEAYRPLLWAGRGIRLVKQQARFRELVERTQIPFVTTWGAADLMPTDHPLHCGVVGVSGQRGANRIVHMSDFLLALGSSVSITQTGNVWNKTPWIVHGELLGDFFYHAENWQTLKREQWEMDYGYAKIENARRIPDKRFTSYLFNEIVTQMLPAGTAIVVDGGGTTLYTGMQSSYIKEGSRLICSTAISAMGSGLPEAVGACFANAKRLTTCLIGDGSFMLNIQELQTIKHHALPIKIFVINNGGYLAIRHTQAEHLEGRFYGTSEADCSLPKLRQVAQAFGIDYWTVHDEAEANATLPLALAQAGPSLIEVFTSQDQEVCRAAPGKELAEMLP